jgi:hypothetical protein
MDIKEFFSDESKVKKFLGAKTEQEARSILEFECGEISDEDFNEIKSGFVAAVSETDSGKASGGLDLSALKSPTATKVYTAAAGILAVLEAGVIGKNIGKNIGEKIGAQEVERRYDDAKKDVKSWVTAGGFQFLGRGTVGDDRNDWYHMVKKSDV